MTDDTGDECMRDAADWMVESDHRILELLREHGSLTPAHIEAFDGPSKNHASRRMNILAEATMVERVHPDVDGLYRITDAGIGFLEERVDAETLPVPSGVDEDDGDTDSDDTHEE